MLDVGSSVVFSEAELHGVLVVVGSVVHAAHHSLIITEEEDGKTGDTVDEYQKTTLLILVYHIVLADSIHRDDGKSPSITLFKTGTEASMITTRQPKSQSQTTHSRGQEYRWRKDVVLRLNQVEKGYERGSKETK